ncbi:hypothetical protein DY000_02042892 [Brassica cretica]|uniref:Uncharacterized protein n=1 Tax=Brassica cretica TaxID=69181 RepID=A0ABQ7BBP3_BRACR|nr:hypothetical protein DY000_02042892 [Brassica cretica]
MAVVEQDDPSEFTPREAELQRQIDGLQSQVTDLHKPRETTENPELSSKVQRLKEKIGEHSKQLELSTEKLNQLQTENAALPDHNKAPNTASSKKRRFNTRVRPMGNLSTPKTGEGTTNATPASGVAGETREGIEDHQIHDLEESDSEPEPEKTAAESSITAYLEQMFSKSILKSSRSILKRSLDRKEGSNLSYVTMAVVEQDDPSEFTPREAELQRQIDGLQSQVTDLHKPRETTENPELSSEVQSLKEKIGEHSKQLELSTEKLNQLQTENTALRDHNKAPNTASSKKHRFNTRVRPMGNLSTPNTGEGTTNATPASRVAGETREGIEDHQIHDLEESDSKPEPEKTAAESSITAYLEQMFS